MSPVGTPKLSLIKPDQNPNMYARPTRGNRSPTPPKSSAQPQFLAPTYVQTAQLTPQTAEIFPMPFPPYPRIHKPLPQNDLALPRPQKPPQNRPANKYQKVPLFKINLTPLTCTTQPPTTPHPYAACLSSATYNSGSGTFSKTISRACTFRYPN